MFDPDICLCTGFNCIIKQSCLRYRYHLRASKEKYNYNTYFSESPQDKFGNCSFYIKVEG